MGCTSCRRHAWSERYSRTAGNSNSNHCRLLDGICTQTLSLVRSLSKVPVVHDGPVGVPVLLETEQKAQVYLFVRQYLLEGSRTCVGHHCEAAFHLREFINGGKQALVARLLELLLCPVGNSLPCQGRAVHRRKFTSKSNNAPLKLPNDRL